MRASERARPECRRGRLRFPGAGGTDLLPAYPQPLPPDQAIMAALIEFRWQDVEQALSEKTLDALFSALKGVIRAKSRSATCRTADCCAGRRYVGLNRANRLTTIFGRDIIVLCGNISCHLASLSGLRPLWPIQRQAKLHRRSVDNLRQAGRCARQVLSGPNRISDGYRLSSPCCFQQSCGAPRALPLPKKETI